MEVIRDKQSDAVRIGEATRVRKESDGERRQKKLKIGARLSASYPLASALTLPSSDSSTTGPKYVFRKMGGSSKLS